MTCSPIVQLLDGTRHNLGARHVQRSLGYWIFLALCLEKKSYIPRIDASVFMHPLTLKFKEWNGNPAFLG